MPTIQLPDGSDRNYDGSVTGETIAADISKGLAKNAVAVRVDGELWDLTRSIDNPASVEIITRDSEDGLELLRHDAAHVMAEAVKEIWPETQVTIGPAIEDGQRRVVDLKQNPLHDLAPLRHQIRGTVRTIESDLHVGQKRCTHGLRQWILDPLARTSRRSRVFVQADPVREIPASFAHDLSPFSGPF